MVREAATRTIVSRISETKRLPVGTSSRIESFDGLRAFAILLVIAGHTFDNLVPAGVIPGPVVAVLGNSTFGVRLFFVLSGYLITTLLMHEQSTRGVVSLWNFYIRRTLRIFPALYAYLCVIALVVGMGWLSISKQQFIAAASYTWNYGALWITDGTEAGSWFLGHLWTLALEEQFYLFWPIAFVLLPSRASNAAPWVIAACLPFVRVATYFLVPEWRGLLGMMFHTAIDSILIGCGFALARTMISVRLQQFPISTAWIVLSAVPLLISPLLRLQFGGEYAVTVGFTIDAVCVGSLLVLLHEERAPAIALSLLKLPVLQWVGRLSYSLYLWQQPFLTPLNATFTSTIPWCFAMALAAACCSYYFVEMPVLRWKNWLQRGRVLS